MRESNVAAVSLEAFTDLRSQFSGWSKHQDTRSARSRSLFVFKKPVQNGQRKCCCFSCSRLSATDHIAAGKQRWNGSRLNWSWVLIFFFIKCTSNWFYELKFSKCFCVHNGTSFSCANVSLPRTNQSERKSERAQVSERKRLVFCVIQKRRERFEEELQQKD